MFDLTSVQDFEAFVHPVMMHVDCMVFNRNDGGEGACCKTKLASPSSFPIAQFLSFLNGSDFVFAQFVDFLADQISISTLLKLMKKFICGLNTYIC
ncbi:hypothetical protein Patl1_07225 [Pistacia atlantica]|uniref:Uncharacterized protein n=1 Tax=Pistacia atlantica TaxID=434234 RepID=A0ACC1AI82_9ROSI|nr:hypothetical protein Patl1_07225 [Pistacia atlantica]